MRVFHYAIVPINRNEKAKTSVNAEVRKPEHQTIHSYFRDKGHEIFQYILPFSPEINFGGAMHSPVQSIKLLIFLLSTILFADLRSGFIQSSDGEPVGYAIITDKSKTNWTVSDQNGYYSHNFNTEPGDTLYIRRLGYETAFLIISDEYSNPFILQSKAIPLESVTVEKPSRPFDLPENTVILNHQESGFLPGYLPGLGWNSYGGRTGNQSLYFDGGQSGHTKILFENISITDPQSGGSDITLIPQTLIRQATLYSTPGVYFGSGVIDGAINLNSKPQNDNEIKLIAGSFGYRQSQLTLSFMDSPFKLSLDTGVMKDRGDYFINNGRESIKRENNNINQTFGLIRSEFHYGQQTQFSALLMTTNTSRGISGSEDWLTPLARRKDNFTIGKLNAVYLNTHGHLGITLTQFKNVQTYNDENPNWPIHSKHEPKNSGIHLNWVHRFNKTFLNQTMLELKNEKITSTDVGDHSRSLKSLITRGSLKMSDRIKVTPTLRYDISSDYHQNITGDLRLTFQKETGDIFRVSGGTAYREPTLNDLFWPEGMFESGNPQLEPEHSQIISLDWTTSLFSSGGLQFRFTDRLTNNLIQWAENENGVWSPENIASAKRLSIVISGELGLSTLPVKIGWNTNFFKTKNLTTGKPLQYIPSIQGFINTKIPLNNASISGLIYYCGKRPYTVKNWNSIEVDKFMGSYFRFDINVDYILPILNNDLNLELALKNVFNKDIRTLPKYPEPGQNWTISINYTPTNLFSR